MGAFVFPDVDHSATTIRFDSDADLVDVLRDIRDASRSGRPGVWLSGPTTNDVEGETYSDTPGSIVFYVPTCVPLRFEFDGEPPADLLED